MTSISESTHDLPRYSIFAADCPAEAGRDILLRLLAMAASATVAVAVMALAVAHFASA
jgi:hypothetical protein